MLRSPLALRFAPREAVRSAACNLAILFMNDEISSFTSPSLSMCPIAATLSLRCIASLFSFSSVISFSFASLIKPGRASSRSVRASLVTTNVLLRLLLGVPLPGVPLPGVLLLSAELPC